MVVSKPEGEFNPQEEYTWRRAVNAAHERLKGKGISRLAQPMHEYQDLGNIEAIDKVHDVALANMLTRHQAWYSYATTELAFSNAELYCLDEIYDVLIGEEMYKISLTKDGRPTKDVLKSLAIQGNEVLKYWHRRKMDLGQDVKLLEGMVSGLSIRCRALESESIRRASQRRVETR